MRREDLSEEQQISEERSSSRNGALRSVFTERNAEDDGESACSRH